MNCGTALFPFVFFLCCQNVHGSPIKGIEDIHTINTYLPNYATVLISLGALLLCVYFVLGCVCCPNKSIKALSYQNGFPVSRLNENAFENSAEITIFPPHSTVIDLQPVSQSFPGFDDKVTFEPLPDILPKNFTAGQSAACSSRPAHFSALLKSKVSLHDWFDDPNSNFPREQLQYLHEIGVGWFGRVIQGEASQICDKEEKTAVIVKILREEASPSEHLHFLHEVRPYRDLKHSNIIKLLGRCLESDPFLLIMEHSISDLKTYLIKQDKRDNFIQDGLMLQMISNIASGLRYMHDKGFCHMDLAAHNCFVCSDNSVKIGDYGISFDRWKNDYYCLGDVALPIRWYSPEILRCSETTIETKEITREANVWAFGVVLWEIVELGKLPYEDFNDEEVIQKVLIEKSVQLCPPILDMICKDEIILVMRECWKPKKYRPSMEKIESYIMQLYNDRLSIKKQELSFEERWNSIQPRITEISSYTGTESSSLKFENDFSTRSDLQNYSSDNEILSSFEMSFDMLPKTGFNGQLSPSLNVLNGSIDELTENDVYLNSISLSCGKYDADTLSNISDKDNFQMEEDKENSHANNIISEQISAAIKDLDLVLASQPDCSKNSTLQKTKFILDEPEVIVKNKEQLANTLSNESQYLSKSSDLSNISESSFSKSSNFSEHVDHVIKDRCNDLSIYSDVNGNCSSYDNVSRENSDIDCVNEPDVHYLENVLTSDKHASDHDKSNNVFMEDTEKLYEIDPESNHAVIEPPVTFSEMGDSKLSSVPDIVIHESPSENVENNNKYEHNNSCTEHNQNSQKKFRFIFKDAAETVVAEINHQDFSKEIAIDLNESLKKGTRLKPLTSTPVKSSSDSGSLSLDLKSTNLSENDDGLCDVILYEKNLDAEETNHDLENCKSEALCKEDNLSSAVELDFKNALPNVVNSGSNEETSKLSEFDNFVTAESSLFSQTGDFSKRNISESVNLTNNDTCVNCTEADITINIFDSDVAVNTEIPGDIEAEQSNISNTVYVSADSSLSKEDYSKALSDVISPPNGYVSSQKELNLSDCENEFLEDSKASETVSPPQAFQDDGLAAISDSFSESKLSFDQELSTSAECGSSENLDQYLEDDHISQSNISAAKLLETSFPDVTSKSFIYENCADFSGNMRPRKNSSNFSISESEQRNSQLYHSDYASDCDQSYDRYKSMKAPIQSYDQMIVEDLDTGEQTVINESYSVCDDYENSGESDEILKINIETDEAIIVDSSEALIGFVPSRSIELLQEFEVIPPLNPSYPLDDEKESSDSMNIDAYNSASASPSPAALKHNSSPYESPEPAYPQPYRNFCLQNEVIEEEITDEIVSPSSFHSSSSYCSNEIFLDEEKMSQSSESAHQGEMFETSVMPSMDHIYVASDDGSKTDVSSSECSPVKQNAVVNAKFRTDVENNHLTDGSQEDVMHSYQPTQSVRWLSDETLDVGGDEHSPIIIEGKEILAGDIMQTCELTAEDIASALSQLEAKGHFHGLTPNQLNVSQSPSPYSSVESSPCRDTVYTPDFESDSEETGSGTSCSSTSGSFECIHNKFKNTVDISRVLDESDKSASSREQSPTKVFSKTWDCHATPTRGVLVTPEKKFNSMRKSVSFHEEDPQVVFEYPPASDSSEDGYPSDENEEFNKNIDYLKYADWDLQVADSDDIENEEILEIEELDSEPYVRRPAYSSSSVGPLNRPMLYTLTAGFSDEDLDLSETVPPASLNAPSNSPDGEKSTFMSASEISELIQSHLNNLTGKENQVEAMEDAASNANSTKEGLSAPMTSVQEFVVSSVDVDDIIIDELLPECKANIEKATVHKENKNAKSNFDKLSASDDEEIEEVIIEELSDDESTSDSFEYNKENEPIVLEPNTFSSLGKEKNCKTSVEILNNDEKVSDVICTTRTDLTLSSDFSVPCCPPEVDQSKEKKLSTNVSEPDMSVANDLKNSNVLESQPNDCDISLIETITKEETDFKITSEKPDDNVSILLNDSPSQDKSKNSEEISKGKVHCHFSNDSSTTGTSLIIEPETSNASDVLCNLSDNPVHAVSQEINVKQNVISHNSEHSIGISCDNISKTPHSNFDTVSLVNFVKEVDSSDKNTVVDASTNEVILSSEKSRTSECLLKHNLADSILQSDISIPTNETVRGLESVVSDDSALISNNLNENSLSVEENVAQNTTLLIDSSNSALAGLSNTVSPLIIITDEVVSGNTSSSQEDNMTSKPEILVDIANSDETLLANNSNRVDVPQSSSELSLDVPKIIVTPASESEVEDELEEYLRGQLEHFHSEASAQEDFTVTSEYSCKPFDDVFESYVSGDSSDYIEAFNFEFENGNFFEDFIDDYPRDLHTGANDRLYLDDGQHKRSSSLPLMTENISDDDSLTMKSDSSLIYDSSKGITRL